MASKRESERLQDLEGAFRRRFGSAPATHLVRAPGRVNLIGDHTDYNGLPVLPMTLQRNIAIFFREREDQTVQLDNLDVRFRSVSFELGKHIRPGAHGDWSNYAKAAGEALWRCYGRLRGFEGVVSGDIPVAAGLSSSSALIVAVALALIEINAVSIEPLDLMSLLARAEQYAGTEGGGMDQAVCVGGGSGSAVKIEFEPLRLTKVPVPKSWSFIVAFSRRRAEKSGKARDAYNSRAAQCRQALKLINDHIRPGKPIRNYSDLMASFETDALLATADDVLGEPLRSRFRHVITEAVRVEEACRAMAQAERDRFGRLMSESHRSLRDDFEVSCSELDELVGVAGEAGACGTRLTGAGFGGCAVALCSSQRAPSIMAALAEKFYQPRGATHSLSDDLFIAEPSPGAAVVKVG